MGSVFGNIYECIKESHVAVWIFQVFRAPNKMSNSSGNCGGSASGASGALSLMGCVREASPPPHDTSGIGEFNMPRNSDTLPKGKCFFFTPILYSMQFLFSFLLFNLFFIFIKKKETKKDIFLHYGIYLWMRFYAAGYRLDCENMNGK